jgi:hypothetical protein
LHCARDDSHGTKSNADIGGAETYPNRYAPAETSRHARGCRAAALFLASDDAGWITGVILDVAGGAVMARWMHHEWGERPMSESEAATNETHRAPNPGIVAVVFALLFNAGLSFVISFSRESPHYPGPWESAETIVAYFRG